MIYFSGGGLIFSRYAVYTKKKNGYPSNAKDTVLFLLTWTIFFRPRDSGNYILHSILHMLGNNFNAGTKFSPLSSPNRSSLFFLPLRGTNNCVLYALLRPHRNQQDSYLQDSETIYLKFQLFITNRSFGDLQEWYYWSVVKVTARNDTCLEEGQ